MKGSRFSESLATSLLPFRGLVAFLLLFASGCADVTTFESSAGLGDGVRDRGWGSEEYLEPLPESGYISTYGNGGSSSIGVTFTDYALKSNANAAWLAASFYDESRGKYTGYVRAFTDVGWSGLGNNFQRVAIDSGGNNFTSVSLGVSDSGLAAASFLYATGGSTKAYTSYYNGSWRPASSSSTFTGMNIANLMNSTSSATIQATFQGHLGNPFVSLFDSVGRTYLFLDAPTLFKIYEWEQAASSWSTSTLSDGSGLSISTVLDNTYEYQATDAVFDGKRYTCFLYEGVPSGSSVRSLLSYCIDGATSVSTMPTLSPRLVLGESPNLISLEGYSSYGFDLATDRNGKILAVYYQSLGSGNYAFASKLMTDGVWADEIETLPVELDTGYQVAAYGAATPVSAPKPQVTSLGSGRFLAVFSAVHTSDLKARVYSAVYTVGSGWSEPSSVIAETTYTARIPFLSYHLFGNGDDNAGLAVSYISETGATALLDRVSVMVGRYHAEDGWLEFLAKGNGCVSTEAAYWSYCRKRPAGAMLSNGSSVVVFPDQDLSGNYRLRSVAFR